MGSFTQIIDELLLREKKIKELVVGKIFNPSNLSSMLQRGKEKIAGNIDYLNENKSRIEKYQKEVKLTGDNIAYIMSGSIIEDISEIFGYMFKNKKNIKNVMSKWSMTGKDLSGIIGLSG